MHSDTAAVAVAVAVSLRFAVAHPGAIELARSDTAAFATLAVALAVANTSPFCFSFAHAASDVQSISATDQHPISDEYAATYSLANHHGRCDKRGRLRSGDCEQLHY